MKVGYARVSSMDQNLDRQLWEIRKAGAEKIFQEKLSGKSMNSQVELQQALQFLREKDVLVIESLDRLGRNYAEIVQIVQKGVPSAYEEFVSIRNRFKNFAVILYI